MTSLLQVAAGLLRVGAENRPMELTVSDLIAGTVALSVPASICPRSPLTVTAAQVVACRVDVTDVGQPVAAGSFGDAPREARAPSKPAASGSRSSNCRPLIVPRRNGDRGEQAGRQGAAGNVDGDFVAIHIRVGRPSSRLTIGP